VLISHGTYQRTFLRPESRDEELVPNVAISLGYVGFFQVVQVLKETSPASESELPGSFFVLSWMRIARGMFNMFLRKIRGIPSPALILGTEPRAFLYRHSIGAYRNAPQRNVTASYTV
jgi:hypothetical protein